MGRDLGRGRDTTLYEVALNGTLCLLNGGVTKQTNSHIHEHIEGTKKREKDVKEYLF
jgi:hypothetical protein